MAEPYLDRNKLVQFLAAHPPAVKGNLTLLLDPTADRGITSEYPIMLRIQNAEGMLHLGLAAVIMVRDLFPPDSRHFTTEKLAELSDAGELDEAYTKLVEEELKLFQFKFAWEISEPKSFDVGKVKKREHLNSLLCYIRVQGNMGLHLLLSGRRYVTRPYISLTDDPVRIGSLLDQATLDQGWQECWVGPIRFREFT